MLNLFNNSKISIETHITETNKILVSQIIQRNPIEIANHNSNNNSNTNNNNSNNNNRKSNMMNNTKNNSSSSSSSNSNSNNSQKIKIIQEVGQMIQVKPEWNNSHCSNHCNNLSTIILQLVRMILINRLNRAFKNNNNNKNLKLIRLSKMHSTEDENSQLTHTLMQDPQTISHLIILRMII